METLVPFMKWTISQEYTFFGTKLKFMLVIWAKVGPTRTPKDLEEGVIRNFTQQTFKRSLHINNSSRYAINEETSSGEGITPIAKRKRCMGKKGNACFNNVAVLALSTAILLVGVRT
jgi:hypothetical protein